MPVFELQTPDGKTFEVDAPDADTAIRSLGEMVNPRPSTSPEGLAKSYGSGVVKGAVGLATMPQDLGNWIGEQAGYGIGRLFGRSPEEASANVSKMQDVRKQLGTKPMSGQEMVAGIEKTIGPLYEPKTKAEKYARTLGEFTPGMLMGPGSWGQKLTSGISSALGSEAAGQATEGSAWEPIARIGGALAGGMLPSAVKHVISPFPVNAERAKNIRTLRKEGVPLTAGQATGRKGLAYMESELGGGKASQMMEDQAEQFTRAAASKAGLNTTRLGPDVMNKAFDDIGAVFDDLASRTQVPLDPQMQDDMLAAVTEYQSISGAPAAAPEQLMNTIAKLADNNGGALDGKAYKTISSLISKYRRGSGDYALKEALHGIKEAMDDAIERGMSPDLVDQWRKARSEYRNLLVLENAMGRNGEGVAEGLLSPSGLRGATASVQGKRNYITGDGDFADLARAGENLLKPLPNSGTAGRLSAQNLGMGAGGIIGAIAGSGAGAPGMTIGGIAGMATPYVAGRLLMTKPIQAYLANLLMKQGTPLSTTQKMAIPLMGVNASVPTEKLIQALEDKR